jgi:hypothetical protein
MRARLEAEIHAVPASGATAAPTAKSDAIGVTLRFAGGGSAHRIAGYLSVEPGATLVVTPVGVAPSSLRGESPRIEVAFSSAPDALVGLDVVVTPPAAPLHWELFVDDKKLPAEEVFAGPFGLAAPGLQAGLLTDDDRAIAFSPKPAVADPRRDLGLFVTRERGAEPEAVGRAKGTAGSTEEMSRLMREWGYAHDKESTAPAASPPRK